ncbi:MAG: PepSY domain-containing protein [Thiomicrorhabdus sp.]|nr:PepSY domain-containing protein [Thiomicrorhabdus sp.]
MNTRKLHKKAGIFAGLLLFILSITGFFLNHDQWSFQYHWTLPNSVLPDAVSEADKKLFQVKTVQPNHDQRVIVGGLRGLFVSNDGGENFQQQSNHQFYALSWMGDVLYGATEDGVWVSRDFGITWRPFALQGRWVNALAVDGEHILASVEKSQLVHLTAQGKVLQQGGVKIPESELAESITLARFVRDFHYGRGFLDDGWSLLLNDIATWILIFSIISGTFIWWTLTRARAAHQVSKTKRVWLKKTIKIHRHGLVLLAIPFLVLFAITGIVLDHSKFFGPYLKEVTWSQSTLPPVYQTLREDIWSVDIESQNQVMVYRIGNRYGVYESRDMQTWQKVSDGFAYRMKRLGDTLYVSGMGSPPRSYSIATGWQILDAPSMFRDVYLSQASFVFFGGHGETDSHVPLLSDSTFYSVMLTLHDGTFFAEWWIWVNDFVSVLLILLLITGVIRWKKKYRSA